MTLQPAAFLRSIYVTQPRLASLGENTKPLQDSRASGWRANGGKQHQAPRSIAARLRWQHPWLRFDPLVHPRAWLAVGARVRRGSVVWAGACINQGIAVGTKAVIGGGAAVVRDPPANCTAVGVPAHCNASHSNLAR